MLFYGLRDRKRPIIIWFLELSCYWSDLVNSIMWNTSDNSAYLIVRNRINTPGCSPQYSNVCLLIWFTSIFYIWLCEKQKKNAENKITEGVGRSKDKKHGREAGSYITPYVLREKSDKWTEKCKPGIFDYRVCEALVNASDPIIAVNLITPRCWTSTVA